MLSLFISLILALEVTIFFDFLMVWYDKHFKLRCYALSICLLAASFSVIGMFSNNYGWIFPLILPLAFIGFRKFVKHEVRQEKNFKDVDFGKRKLYGGKKVLIIVPHQDDEINLLGGIFEEFLKYGSEVFPVYVITNGAIEGFRYEEALKLFKHIGVPEANITFLGYGSLKKNVVDDIKCTKGTDTHPAYHEGQSYSRENIVDDLVKIITATHPDIIIGTDYDKHIDHHYVSVLTDEAIGCIFKQNDAYRPVVLKGYAYRTTWESYPDYYGENILSTKYLYNPVETFRWNDRLRLPVAAHMMSRSLLASEIYKQYAIFKSQGAVMRAICYNTDKIVWERRTKSVLYNAKITTSSGDGAKLNDFMLYDKQDFTDVDALPLSGAWIPTSEDTLKMATIELPKPHNIKYLVIYNNVDKDQLVSKVSIAFNDKLPVEYDLQSDGKSTRIDVDEQQVTSLSIKILEYHGKQAGLTEVEAFEDAQPANFNCVKTINNADDFVYDYWIDKTGTETFGFYTMGNVPVFSKQNYEVSVDNSKCSAVIENDKLHVHCPKGEHTLLQVISKDKLYSDTVFISNPTAGLRLKNKVCQFLEAKYYDLFIGDQHRKATTLSLLWSLKKITNRRK